MSEDRAWQARPAWDEPQVEALAGMTDDSLRQSLKGSSMKRAKIAGLRRNFAVAQDNAAARAER